MDIHDVLTIHMVAERMGIDVTTAQRYRYRGLLPVPDAFIGRYPLWRATTIDRFMASRPGRGTAADPRTDRRRKMPRLDNEDAA